jgi:hypothetical protein
MCEMLYAPTLLIFGIFVTIMVLIVCDDDDILFCITVYSTVILYTYIYCCVLLCINTRKYLFFGPVWNISGAYFLWLVAHLALVAHIAICATHSILMAHIGYAPLKGKLCVAHIEMRHGYICTNGVAMVAHTICAKHSSNWCATNSLFSTSVLRMTTMLS